MICKYFLTFCRLLFHSIGSVLWCTKLGFFWLNFVFFLFLSIFYWLYYYSCPIYFSPLFFSVLKPPPTSIPPLSSCPWVAHISSLAFPFPILFLTSPCLFCAYLFCFLLPVPFPPIYPLPLPADNAPCDLHFCDSVPILVACLVFVFIF